MSTIRHPVGPQPPSVYWRRRLVVLGGLLIVIVVIVLIVVRPGSGDAGQAAAPDSSASAEPTTEPSVDATAACDPEVVRVRAVTDSDSYAKGEKPLVSMTIENTGAVACTYDVGTGAQEYLVTSGADRIWSSADCQTDPTENPIVLTPGDELTTEPFAWDRTRSSTSTCDESRDKVVAGGASYHLEVHLGDSVSADTKQFVLQ